MSTRPKQRNLGRLSEIAQVAVRHGFGYAIDGRKAGDPETGQTGNPKYFAAGDAVSGGATVVQAVRGAKTAARGIDAWLRGRS